MSDAEDTQALADALLQRARRLAEEERKLAEHERERLLRNAGERLAQRREQAEKQATQRAEQHYRRLVQRAEQEVRAKLEKLRWTLIQAVLADLKASLSNLHKEPERYRQLLRALLQEGAKALPDGELLGKLNDRDHALFEADWTRLLEESGGRSDIALSGERCASSGGLVLHNAAGDVRLDNTFEARLERLTPDIAQGIDEILFGSLRDKGEDIHAG